MQSGEGIRFDETRLTTAIGAKIDAAAISASEFSPGGKCDALGFRHFRIVVRTDQIVSNQVFAALFVDIRVRSRFRSGQQHYLQRPEHSRVAAAAENADGEFAPAKIGFHQHRLAESLKQRSANCPEFSQKRNAGRR